MATAPTILLVLISPYLLQLWIILPLVALRSTAVGALSRLGTTLLVGQPVLLVRSLKRNDASGPVLIQHLTHAVLLVQG